MSKSDEDRAKEISLECCHTLSLSASDEPYLRETILQAFQSIRAEQIEKDAGIAEWHWYYFRKANPTVEDRGHKDASFTIATKIRNQEVE